MNTVKLVLVTTTIVVAGCKKKNFNDNTQAVVPNAPLVQTINPVRAQYGTTVTITGKRFGTIAANSSVVINNITITPQTVNDSVITFIVPKGMGSGAVNVKNLTLTGTGPSFEYLYTGNVTLFSGNGDNAPAAGTVLNVGWNNLRGITSDGNGTIYVCDEAEQIRKIDAQGNVTLLPAAPNGTLISPKDILYDVVNNQPSLLITSYRHNIYRYQFSNQQYTIEAGIGQAFYTDSIPAGSAFNNPACIAKKSDGSYYITELSNYVVRRLVRGVSVSTPAGMPRQPGDVNGPGNTAKFLFPLGIYNEGGDNFLVADMLSNKLKRITPANAVETVAGTTEGFTDGPVATAKLTYPTSSVKDNAGNIIITCADNTIRCISASGYVYTLAGVSNIQAGAYVNGIGSAARFSFPIKAILIGNATFLITDLNNRRIRKMILE
jgi:hypothetical protein